MYLYICVYSLEGRKSLCSSLFVLFFSIEYCNRININGNNIKLRINNRNAISIEFNVYSLHETIEHHKKSAEWKQLT